MDPIITYRQTGTGLWRYHFYTGKEYIGKVSCALSLLSTVRVEVEPVSWYSTFHADTLVFPGVSRKVMDDHTEREAFRIVFCELGFYRLMSADSSLLVECRDNAFLFGNPGQPVLAMTERISECAWVPAGEPVFRTIAYEDISAEVRAAIVSFPALRF